MNDPDTIKVDEEMHKRAFFVVRLVESPVPVNTIEFHKALCRGNIYETCLRYEVSVIAHHVK